MPWEDQIVTIQFRVPRDFKNDFQDWCEGQGVTMSSVLVYFISTREQHPLPPQLKRPWIKPQGLPAQQTDPPH